MGTGFVYQQRVIAHIGGISEALRRRARRGRKENGIDLGSVALHGLYRTDGLRFYPKS